MIAPRGWPIDDVTLERHTAPTLMSRHLHHALASPELEDHPLQTVDARPIPAMTRKAALGDARIAYMRLVIRARQVHPDRRQYIEAIAARWDARLVDLQRFTGSTIPGWTQRVFEQLMTSADERAIDDADLLDWIDAFPDAIADIFPPSAATFQGMTAQKGTQPTARAAVKSRLERPAA